VFQSALIRSHKSGPNSTDAGTIAETLLFYNRVHVVADRGLLADLVSSIGLQNLLTLLADRRLSITYSRSVPAVFSQTTNYVSEFFFTAVVLHAHPDGKRIHNADEVRDAVVRGAGDSRVTRKGATRLLDYLQFKNVGPQKPGDSAQTAAQELSNPAYVKPAIKTLIERLAPGYQFPTIWDFKPIFAENGKFLVATDLDFRAINQEYHRHISPEHSSITIEYLLAHLLDTRVDIDLSAHYMSELVTRRDISELIKLRFERILARRDMSSAEIASFQEVFLGDARAVREAINSGERQFSDFLRILQKADRFKDWLAERNPDAGLLLEYYKAVTSDTWIGKLRGKSLRYIMTTVTGLVEPISGLLASAADEFIVDRVFKGWHPNQFVEGPLKRFTSID
jgi:hypothetical protein